MATMSPLAYFRCVADFIMSNFTDMLSSCLLNGLMSPPSSSLRHPHHLLFNGLLIAHNAVQKHGGLRFEPCDDGPFHRRCACHGELLPGRIKNSDRGLNVCQRANQVRRHFNLRLLRAGLDSNSGRLEPVKRIQWSSVFRPGYRYPRAPVCLIPLSHFCSPETSLCQPAQDSVGLKSFRTSCSALNSLGFYCFDISV